jgi:uncharacterized delta-60 repeat protein
MKNMTQKIYTFSIFLLFFSVKMSSQSGIVDPAFGTNGIVATSINSGDEEPLAMAFQPDKKILVAGYSIFQLGGFVILRYLENGDLDTTFNHTGHFALNLSADTIAALAYSVQVQQDGKILACGYEDLYHPDVDQMVIIRLNPDGSYDTTFGNNGIVTLEQSIASRANQILVQADGKYLIGGNSNIKGRIIRLNDHGDLDNTFANNGMYEANLNSIYYSDIISMQFQSDGKIVAGGFRINSIGGYLEYAIIRLTPDGVLDSLNFGLNGIASYNSGEDNGDFLTRIAILPNDDFLAAGRGGIAKFNKDGVQDISFGSTGAIPTPVYDVAVQADGKLVSPIYPTQFISNFKIIRFNANGTIDSTFAIDGITNTDYNHKNEEAILIGVQPDQKIVAAGITQFGTSNHFMLARYLSGLELSTSDFSTNPISTLVYPNPVSDQTTLQITLDQPTHIAVQLLDINGRLIKTCLNREAWMPGKQQTNLSLPSNLPPGTYLLKVQADDKSAVIKVIKQ